MFREIRNSEKITDLQQQTKEAEWMALLSKRIGTYEVPEEWKKKTGKVDITKRIRV